MNPAGTVLVGTLYCGEGDFDECRRSVAEQDYPCRHEIIADLPEPEAHHRLYSLFQASDADLLVKLDADMVLKNKRTLGLIVSRMARSGGGPGYQCVSHHVDDYFTGRPILGVHCYSRSVQFDLSALRPGELFTDRRNSVLRLPPAERAKAWKIFDDAAAWHCRFATPRQAFHFGYHRMMKHQHGICGEVLANLGRHPADERLAMACAGMVVGAERPDPIAASYGPAFESVYELAAPLVTDIPTLRERLGRLLPSQAPALAAR